MTQSELMTWIGNGWVAVVPCLMVLFSVLLAGHGLINSRKLRHTARAVRGTWKRVGALRFGPTRQLPNDDLYRRLTQAILIASVLSFVLFLSLPWLDVSVSRLFWFAEDGFVLDKNPGLQALRRVYGAAFWLMFWVSLGMFLFAARHSASLTVPVQIWGFVVTAQVLGPGLLANTLFKEHWGRARPADIAAFGGEAAYTPPFEMANQCARNCSFVSGEGSAIAMMAILLGVLAWPWLRARHLSWTIALTGVASLGVALRIVKGRHFLSDTVFAILLMALVVLLLYRAFDIARHRHVLTWDALVADLKAARQYITGGVAAPISVLSDLWLLGHAAGRVLLRFGRLSAAAFPNPSRPTGPKTPTSFDGPCAR